MFLTSKPSQGDIRAFLARQVQSRFSYPKVGASANTCSPVGFVADHSRVLLGYGQHAWELAVSAANNWQMFNLGWVQLCWPEVPLNEGRNVAVLIRHFGFWSLNAARIVYTIRENEGPVKRYGFAYGTLLDHGESGEERFVVELHGGDDSVWYDLFAFSRPRAIATWLGYPLARWLQYRFRQDSMVAMVRATKLHLCQR